MHMHTHMQTQMRSAFGLPVRLCMHIYTHAHTRQVVLAESLFALAWRSGMADKAHLRKVARMVGRLSKTHGKEYADLQMRLDVLC